MHLKVLVYHLNDFCALYYKTKKNHLTNLE